MLKRDLELALKNTEEELRKVRVANMYLRNELSQARYDLSIFKPADADLKAREKIMTRQIPLQI